jgi:hypothetical protein
VIALLRWHVGVPEQQLERDRRPVNFAPQTIRAVGHQSTNRSGDDQLEPVRTRR